MFFARADSSAYRNFSLEVAEDVAPPVRAATWLAPTGLGLLLLATFLATASWVCVEDCVRDAELLEERLLECEESCKTKSAQTSESAGCKDKCAYDVGFTLRK